MADESNTQVPTTSSTPPAGDPASSPAAGTGSSGPAAAAADGTNPGPAAGDGGASDTGGTEAPPPATGGDWATVRDKYAKGDEKIAKRLSRYSSLDSALDALIAAQNKIASGQLKSALPENATPEQLSAWRAEAGIPESVDGYDISIPDDFEMTPEGEAFAKDLLGSIHEANIPPAAAQKLFDKLFEQQQAAEQANAERLEANRAQAEEALRDAWGGDYHLNSNLVNNHLSSAPPGMRDQLLGGTLADGTPIAHSPEFMRWMADMAREINPVATVVPGSGEQAAAAITSEMAAIEALMGDKQSKYWKGADAERLQKRYLDLVSANARRQR